MAKNNIFPALSRIFAKPRKEDVFLASIHPRQGRSILEARNNRGFTLIELLVVIAIIGILATVGTSSFMSAQKRARDGRRKSDFQQLRTGLEMFRSSYNRYPTIGGGCQADCWYGGAGSTANWINDNTYGITAFTQFMSGVPHDPVDRCCWSWDNGCIGTSGPGAGTYVYCGSDGQTYQLRVRFETPDSAANGSSYGDNANTYVVVNP